jgi:TetR/AcrR family transcriptional regulator
MGVAPGGAGRRTRRARGGEETRLAVLRAAEEVFAERGYAGARMDEVAERTGIRRASLVYYFPNKRALYEAVLDDLFLDLRDRYEAILTGPGPLTDRMLRCIDVWAAHIDERPALLPITLREIARARPGRPVPLSPRVQPIVQVLADAVRAGRSEGVFRDVDPVGFVMSVAGTTAFLGSRHVLLGPAIDAPGEPGVLARELRVWVARVLFVG